jgi:hypothetical protein
MGVPTHCLPSGFRGAFQIPVPNINPTLIKMDDATGGAGHRRGRILAIPGLGGSTYSTAWLSAADPAIIGTLNTDGWQVVQCPGVPQSVASVVGPYGGILANYNGFPTTQPAMLADINNDSGNGSRLLATHMNHFDHLVNYANMNFGGAMPTVIAGISWGGWNVIQLVNNRPSLIVAAYVLANPNDLSKVVAGFPLFPIVNGWNSQTSSFFSGMNISVTALNSVTFPTRVIWCTQDGFISPVQPPPDCMMMVKNACLAGGGTVTKYSSVGGSAGTNVTTFTGSQALTLSGSASSAGFSSSGGICFAQTSLGTATITYGGTSGSTLTNCNCTQVSVSGTNTLATSGLVMDALAVAAGANVTGTGLVQNHAWTTTASSDLTTWLTGTIDPSYPKAY